MSWPRAKFRDVPFHADALEMGAGRMGVTHKYPRALGSVDGPPPVREDLGEDVRVFTIEGYVIGDDCIAQRDRLVAALLKGGVGELVHPTYGTVRVSVPDFRVRELIGAQRKVSFSITFERGSAQPTQPLNVVNAAAMLAVSVSAARTSVVDEFLNKYSPGRFLTSAGDQLRKATLAINTALVRVKMETQKLATFKKRLTDFSSAVADVVSEPADIVLQLSDILDLSDVVAPLLHVYAFSPGVRPVGSTPSRLQEQANFDALQALIQRLAALRAAELAPSQIYDSYEDAIAARNAIAALLDEQAETVSDDTYPSLLQLRADLVTAVPGESSDLSSLVKHTPLNTIPSLVLAHQLYGDLSREEDILARNKIRNPAFIPGGRELEVLSRG